MFILVFILLSGTELETQDTVISRILEYTGVFSCSKESRIKNAYKLILEIHNESAVGAVCVKDSSGSEDELFASITLSLAF